MEQEGCIFIKGARANNLKNDVIRVGQTLFIPD